MSARRRAVRAALVAALATAGTLAARAQERWDSVENRLADLVDTGRLDEASAVLDRELKERSEYHRSGAWEERWRGELELVRARTAETAALRSEALGRAEKRFESALAKEGRASPTFELAAARDCALLVPAEAELALARKTTGAESKAHLARAAEAFDAAAEELERRLGAWDAVERAERESPPPAVVGGLPDTARRAIFSASYYEARARLGQALATGDRALLRAALECAERRRRPLAGSILWFDVVRDMAECSAALGDEEGKKDALATVASLRRILSDATVSGFGPSFVERVRALRDDTERPPVRVLRDPDNRAGHVGSPPSALYPFVRFLGARFGGRRNLAARGGGSLRTERAVEEGLAFIASSQRADGAWPASTGAAGVTTRSVTALAVLALLGTESPDSALEKDPRVAVLRRGVAWLARDLGVAEPRTLLEEALVAHALCEVFDYTFSVAGHRDAARAVALVASHASAPGADGTGRAFAAIALDAAATLGFDADRPALTRDESAALERPEAPDTKRSTLVAAGVLGALARDARALRALRVLEEAHVESDPVAEHLVTVAMWRGVSNYESLDWKGWNRAMTARLTDPGEPAVKPPSGLRLPSVDGEPLGRDPIAAVALGTLTLESYYRLPQRPSKKR